jgi:hypothetical protein
MLLGIMSKQAGIELCPEHKAAVCGLCRHPLQSSLGTHKKQILVGLDGELYVLAISVDARFVVVIRKRTRIRR